MRSVRHLGSTVALSAAAISAAGALALTGCSSSDRGATRADNSSAPAPAHSPANLGTPRPAAVSSPQSDGGFAAAFATVAGADLAQESGTGSSSFGALPHNGMLNVIFHCSAGSMRITREPDIDLTATCFSGTGMLSAPARASSPDPVRLSMSDSKATWMVRLVLG